MYEDQSNSQPSPQGPGTLFDASHHQPTGIFLHLSTSAGNQSLVWNRAAERKKSLFQKGGGWVFPKDVKNYKQTLEIKEWEVKFD